MHRVRLPGGPRPARRAPSVLAVLVVALGIVAVASRLDGPSDATVVIRERWSDGSSGVVVEVPGGQGPATQRPRAVLAGAYLAPLTVMGLWAAVLSGTVADPVRMLGLLDAGLGGGPAAANRED